MSAEQIELLNKANRELVKADADLSFAEQIMQTALDSGERFDLLLLTQGRILQKQDRCAEAKQLFGEINVAPHEPSQSVEDIKRIKNKYIEQMGTLCSAQLTLTCADAETILKLGVQDVTCEETVKVTPGAYQLQATLGTNADTYDLELAGAEQRTYRVGLVKIATATPVDTQTNSTTSAEPGGVKTEVAPPMDSTPHRYRKTMISGISTIALTGAAAIMWGVSTGQQDSALEGFINEDGTWKADNDLDAQREAEQSANSWGIAEVGSGFAIPIIAGVGIMTTTLFWIKESRAPTQARNEDDIHVTWRFGATRKSANTGVSITW